MAISSFKKSLFYINLYTLARIHAMHFAILFKIKYSLGIFSPDFIGLSDTYLVTVQPGANEGTPKTGQSGKNWPPFM